MRQLSERVIGHRHGPFMAALACALAMTPVVIVFVPHLAFELVPISL